MPTVPQYGGPQVAEQALNARYQSADQYTTGARTLAEAGQALSKTADVLDRVVVRDAEAKANDTDTQLTRAWNDWEDANRGKFVNQSADGYKAAVEGWWKDAAKNYGSTLDPLAKSMVNKTLARRQTIALDQAGKYESAEKEKYADSTTESAINAATVSALKNGDYAGESERVRGLVAAQGVRKKWDKDQRDTALNARMGSFHTAVIAQLSETDAAGAKAYLEAAIERDEIPPANQPNLEKVITKNYNDQEGKRISQSMAGKTYAEKQEALAEITDADLREAATIHVDRDQARLDRMRTEATKSLLGNAKLSYEKTGVVPSSMMVALEAVDPGVAADLRRAIKADQKAQAREAKGEEIKTDLDAYYQLRRMAMDPETQSKFASTDLMAYRDRVSTTDLKGLMSLQGSINKNDAKAMDQQRQIKETINLVRGSILSAGIDMTPKEGSKAAKEYEKFMGALTMSLTEAQAAQPDKPLTSEQMKKIGMSMVKEGYEQGSGVFGMFKNKRRGYEIVSDPDQAGKTFIGTPYDEIPASVRTDLERAYDKRTPPGGIYGNAVERERAIERAYQLGKEQGRFK